MKNILLFIFPTMKAIVAVFAFLIGLGWAAYGSIYMIVKAEGNEIRREVKDIRQIDVDNINGRFDRADRKLDRIYKLLEKK